MQDTGGQLDSRRNKQIAWIIGGAIFLAGVLIAVAIVVSGGDVPDPCAEWEAAVQQGLDEFAETLESEGGHDSEEGRAILRETMYEDGSITVGGEDYVKPPNCEL